MMFEDGSEVEHVLALLGTNPVFAAGFADDLRRYAASIGAIAPRPPCATGCNERGEPLDPEHPWNGGRPSALHSDRQAAVLTALLVAEQGGDLAGALWAIHAIERDAAVAVLEPLAKKHGSMSSKGGRRGKRQTWAELWASQYPSAAAAWSALPMECPDEPNCGPFCVWRGPAEDGLSVDAEGGQDVMRAIRHEDAAELRPLSRRSFCRYFLRGPCH